MRNYILLSQLLALFFTLGAQAQQEVSGTITSSEGEALPGVNILVKNTTIGTLSTLGGQYAITIPDSISQAVLLFSFVGYEEKEVEVNKQSLIDVTLESSTQQLEEVVVVGYGVIDRQKLAGAVSSIGSEDIEADPVVGLNQAVQGKVAGVQVTQNSGTPGGALNFRVRGVTTLNSSTTEPLYVVDGIPINSDNYGGISAGSRQTINPLASINPADVASVEVLKDASATAIYGARAANGVVLITTRKGNNGSNRINLNAYYGLQELPRTIGMANSAQYRQYITDLATLNDWDDPGFGISDINTNWQEVLYQNSLVESGEIAPIQSYTLSASGGSDQTIYYVSGGYFMQEGIVKGSGYERINLRTNLEHEFNEHIKFGTNINLSRGKTDRIVEDFGGSGPVSLALLSRPNLPVYNGAGKFFLDTLINRDNPLAMAKLPNYYDKVDRILGNIYLEAELLKGLRFRSTAGIDRTDSEGEFYRPKEGIRAGEQRGGLRNTNRFLTFTWLNENTLNYNKEIGDHEFTILAGNTLQNAKISSYYTNAVGFPSDEVVIVNNASSYNAGERLEGWSLVSFFSRVNYIFKDRYIITANYRVDGSSRFGEEKLYGAFPSVAVAWRASEEAFLQNLSAITNLKLRASLGQSGNQPRDFYNAVPLYSISAYYGDYVGFIPQTIGNNQLSWETTTQLNLGLDLDLFDDRVSLLADYYIKKTEDLLTSYRLPQATGTLFTTVNLGNMENKGFEFEITSRNLQGALSWNTSLNMSFPTNKITYLAGEEVLDGLGDASHIVREGYPIGSFFGYIAEGIDPTTGNIIYADIDGDGQRSLPGAVDTDDRTIIGNPHPEFYGGITNSLFYGNFDLSVQGQFVYGNDIWNFTRQSFDRLTGAANNISADALDYWTEANPDASYPRPTIGQTTNDLLSTRWIEDGSFFRLRDITLGYTMPTELSQRLQIEQMRVYIQAQNLHVFTNYSGYDPEINVYENRGSMIGADYASYPRARTFLVGLNLTF